MNFLRISGLVIGTSSVVGGTSVGVYYGVSSENKKIESNGKLVFFKKSGENTNTVYEAKLLTEEKYNSEVSTFNANETDDTKKYDKVNKIIEISNLLKLEAVANKLNNIFENENNLEKIKEIIASKESELKNLFGDKNYENIKKFKDEN